MTSRHSYMGDQLRRTLRISAVIRRLSVFEHWFMNGYQCTNGTVMYDQRSGITTSKSSLESTGQFAHIQRISKLATRTTKPAIVTHMRTIKSRNSLIINEIGFHYIDLMLQTATVPPDKAGILALWVLNINVCYYCFNMKQKLA